MHTNKNSGWCHVHKSYQGRQLLFTDLPFPMSVIVSAAYIKVYLLENGICVAKKKTKSVRKSLDPLYNQVLVFSESPQGKVVQVRMTVELLLDRLDFWTWDEMSGDHQNVTKSPPRGKLMCLPNFLAIDPSFDLSVAEISEKWLCSHQSNKRLDISHWVCQIHPRGTMNVSDKMSQQSIRW